MHTYLKTVPAEALAHAARNSDIDAALAPLMALLGITDGGVAALVFDEDGWSDADPTQRLAMLHHWLETEDNYRK